MKLLSLKQDERGLGHVVLIALIVLVVGVVGFAGYTVTQKNKDKKDSSTSVVSDKEAVKACEKELNDKILCKFTGNYDIDKLPYKMVMTVSGTGNADGKVTFLSDGKGNTSMVSTGSGQQTEAIVLDKVTYFKDNTDGKWFRYGTNDSAAPEAGTPDIKFNTTESTDDGKNVTYKRIGKEKCGKLTCYKYQVIDVSTPDVTQYFWFDTKDYRLQRFSTKDDKGTSDMVITYEKVKISAPSPTKDATAGTSSLDPQALQQAQEAMQSYGADYGE